MRIGEFRGSLLFAEERRKSALRDTSKKSLKRSGRTSIEGISSSDFIPSREGGENHPPLYGPSIDK